MEIFKNIDNQMDLKENSNGMIQNNVPLNQNNKIDRGKIEKEIYKRI